MHLICVENKMYLSIQVCIELDESEEEEAVVEEETSKEWIIRPNGSTVQFLHIILDQVALLDINAFGFSCLDGVTMLTLVMASMTMNACCLELE